jgi:hypothetical protein
VSFPGRSMPAGANAAFGSLYHWDEQAGERDFYGYYHRVSETGRVMPGYGYWRKAIDTAFVTIPRSGVIDSVVEITLFGGVLGWNQIASPFAYPVRWPTGSILWKWNESTHDFEESDGVLEPWQGYWASAESTMTVRLENRPLFTHGASAKRNAAGYSDRNNWQVRVELVGGVNLDAENILGFSGLAKNGLDAEDACEPPRMQEYQYLYFTHPEWKHGRTEYSRDIRRTIEGVETYTIGITPGSVLTKDVRSIVVRGLEKVPSEVQLFISDKADGLPVRLEAGQPYGVEQSTGILYKTLFVTTDRNFLKKYPKTFSLGSPYPNPTRRMANIEYSLPYRVNQAGVAADAPYRIELAIYDLLGRQVRCLASTTKRPGIYGIHWDGKSNAGMYLASGMYFLRLNAESFTSVKRINVVR